MVEAERWVAGERPDPDVLRRTLSPMAEMVNLDTMVLGCTHFPLLRDWLVAAAPDACGGSIRGTPLPVAPVR